jgi:hypothetical protein
MQLASAFRYCGKVESISLGVCVEFDLARFRDLNFSGLLQSGMNLKIPNQLQRSDLHRNTFTSPVANLRLQWLIDGDCRIPYDEIKFSPAYGLGA